MSARPTRALVLSATLLAACAHAADSDQPYYSGNDAIITTEQAQGKIVIFKSNTDWNQATNIIWSWSPADSNTIKPSEYPWFKYPTDCKWVRHGSQVLVSASGGGIAVVRLADHQVLFYAHPGGNTHSVELLPDGNLVSASSTGNFLCLFSTDPAVGTFPNDVKCVKYTFQDAHGVTWDNRDHLLWAVGGTTLKCFSYNENRDDPALKFAASYTIPDTQGHDLFSLPEKNALTITSAQHVWLFDLTTRKFQPFPGLAETANVKSVSVRATDGKIIYLVPTFSWWTDGIRILNGLLQKRDGAQFYKARWWQPNKLSDQ